MSNSRLRLDLDVLTDVTRINFFGVARRFLLEMLVRGTKYEIARAGLVDKQLTMVKLCQIQGYE